MLRVLPDRRFNDPERLPRSHLRNFDLDQIVELLSKTIAFYVIYGHQALHFDVLR